MRVALIARVRKCLRRLDVALWRAELDIELSKLERRGRLIGNWHRSGRWDAIGRSFIMKEHLRRNAERWGRL